MKLNFAFLLVLISNILFSQTDTITDSLRYKAFEEKVKLLNDKSNKAPMQTQWGLARINDSLLADQAEISVGEWLNYIFYNNLTNYPQGYFTKKPENKELFNEVLNSIIDTALLPNKNILDQLPERYLFKKCKSCELITFGSLDSRLKLPIEKDSVNDKESKKRLLKYLQLPIVGISYEQAVGFCKWRTRIDSLRWYIPDPPTVYLSSRHSFVFKLPTPEEFDLLISAFDSIYNEKDIIAHFNYKGAKYSNQKAKSLEDKECGNTRMKVFGNFPGSYSCAPPQRHIDCKIFETQGNVAEMTSVKGIARGGSYNHYAKDSYHGINNYYDKPELWLGFRCVVVRRKL